MPWMVDAQPDVVQVTLSGTAAIGDARALHLVLLELAAGARPVVIDLTRCTSLDCAALQLLLAFHRARSERGAPVEFALGAGEARALLDRLRVADLLRPAPALG